MLYGEFKIFVDLCGLKYVKVRYSLGQKVINKVSDSHDLVTLMRQ